MSCDACAPNFECAWCSSDRVCVTVTEVFARNCRGTVFDLPCPSDAELVGGAHRMHGCADVR